VADGAALRRVQHIKMMMSTPRAASPVGFADSVDKFHPNKGHRPGTGSARGRPKHKISTSDRTPPGRNTGRARLLQSQISTSDRTHARTGPDTPRAASLLGWLGQPGVRRGAFAKFFRRNKVVPEIKVVISIPPVGCGAISSFGGVRGTPHLFDPIYSLEY
jgi:hypothetical protein